MNQIRFSHNWNDKLDRRYFTTIRSHSDKKYNYYHAGIGGVFYVYLKGEIYCEAELLDVRGLLYYDILYSTLLLDTGIEDAEKIDNLFKRFKISGADEVIILTFKRIIKELPF